MAPTIYQSNLYLQEDDILISVEENVKTVIVEEPLNGSKKVENGSKKVDGTTSNTDHTATVQWSDIVKNGEPGSIGDQMSSKEKGKSS